VSPLGVDLIEEHFRTLIRRVTSRFYRVNHS